ncbi:MAG: hypothetical protein IPP55_16585 [Anaerolineales bacterium]|nr:hypothetical protein [Anaerolineales bacterium]
MATKFPSSPNAFSRRRTFRTRSSPPKDSRKRAPTIGCADIISDLVSSGPNPQDNRLRALRDVIQASQAALLRIESLQTNPQALEMARRLLEYIEAHMRAKENLLVIANMRGRESQGDRIQTI